VEIELVVGITEFALAMAVVDSLSGPFVEICSTNARKEEDVWLMWLDEISVRVVGSRNVCRFV
jgi:hypothetical protein